MFSRDEKKPAAVSGGFDLNTFTEEHIYWEKNMLSIQLQFLCSVVKHKEDQEYFKGCIYIYAFPNNLCGIH